MAIFTGDDGDNIFTGGAENDTATGGGGNDTLAGGAGGDTIDGDDGNDTIYAGAISPIWQRPFFVNNPDFLPPVLDVGSEIDVLRGGSGYDTIYAGFGDTVDGGADGGDLLISLQGAAAGVTIDFRALATGGSLSVGGGTISNIFGVLWIDGSEYDDTLTGSDTYGYLYSAYAPIFGRGGNDHLIAGSTTGNIYGGDGNDVIDSAYTNGYYYGDAGDDIINSEGVLSQSFGGDGNDTLNVTGSGHGGDGDDVITLNNFTYSDRMGNGDAGDDQLHGSDGTNRLAGGTGADVIYGYSANDRLNSAGPVYGIIGDLEGDADTGAEHDQLFGGADDDRLSIGYGDDADGGTGINSLALSLLGAGAGVTIDTADLIGGASYALGGGTIQNIQSVEIIWGSNFGDTISFADQAAGITVYGEGGDDRINGTSNADAIHGGGGADIINAGGGDDIIYIDAADDDGAGEQINGGAGMDTIRIAFGSEADLSGATLAGIESIIADSVIVSTTTLGGVESLSGTFRFSNGGVVSLGAVTATGSLFFSLSVAGNEIDFTNLRPSGFFMVFGQDGDDVITATAYGGHYRGGGGNDVLNGGARVDNLFGDEGNDFFFAYAGGDFFDGGTGIDTIDYRHATGPVTVVLATIAGRTGSATGGDRITNIENVNASHFNDRLYGSDDDNLIRGMVGSDTLNGKGGNDVLDGGHDDDTMTGGLGNDVYYVDRSADEVVEADAEGADRVYASASYTLRPGVSVETLTTVNGAATTGINLAGNEFAQVMIGNEGINNINGGGGADVMNGLGGNDYYTVDSALDVVAEAANGGADRIFASVSYALRAAAHVETLSTTNAAGTDAIDLTGNGFANTLAGNAGANVLNGLGGADAMIGYGGDDTYHVDSAGDQVIEYAGFGFDRVYASISYGLVASAAIDYLSTISHAATTAINLNGNSFSQTIIGNAGANTLKGLGGDDTLIGLGGDDLLYVDSASAVVVEGAGGGYDRVLSSVSYTLAAGVHVEMLSTAFTAGAGAIDLTGNELVNNLVGNQGVNILNGMGGSDVLSGMGGADRFAFTTALDSGNVDRILDFAPGIDEIALDDSIFTGIGATLDASEFVIGTAAADASDRIVYNSATGALFFDPDGAGGTAQLHFATLTTGPVVAASDFVMI